MNTFEDRLLTELRQHVVAPPAPAPRRRGRLALAGAGVAAAATAAVVVALGGGASAYAVEKTGSGEVSVHIRSLADAAGLQRELRTAGLPAVVEYSAKELPCGGPPSDTRGATFHTSGGSDDAGPSTSVAGTPPPAGAENRMTSSIARTDDGVQFTIDPGTLPAGKHIYITTSTGSGLDSVGMAIC